MRIETIATWLSAVLGVLAVAQQAIPTAHIPGVEGNVT